MDETKDDTLICYKCGDLIDMKKPYVCLVVQEEVEHTDGEISVLYSEEISAFHKKCSPFKQIDD